MKIVLDTNCLIQSIPRQSRYRKVWESLVRGEYVLCVSTEILEEYVEILLGLGGRIADRCGGGIVEEGLLAGSEHRHQDKQDGRPCGM